MITFGDWCSFIFSIPGGPKVILQEGDWSNPKTVGVLFIYCHRKFLRFFKALDQYNLKPVGQIWDFRPKPHAWLKRNSKNQVTLYSHQTKLI